MKDVFQIRPPLFEGLMDDGELKTDNKVVEGEANSDLEKRTNLLSQLHIPNHPSDLVQPLSWIITWMMTVDRPY